MCARQIIKDSVEKKSRAASPLYGRLEPFKWHMAQYELYNGSKKEKIRFIYAKNMEERLSN